MGWQPTGGGGGGGGGDSSQGGSTGTRTQVNDTTVEGQLLAANTARKRYKITNDSSAVLYLGEGTTVVSSTNYTVALNVNDYWESSFQGQVRGVWATDPNNGAARITEITA